MHMDVHEPHNDAAIYRKAEFPVNKDYRARSRESDYSFEKTKTSIVKKVDHQKVEVPIMACSFSSSTSYQ